MNCIDAWKTQKTVSRNGLIIRTSHYNIIGFISLLSSADALSDDWEVVNTPKTIQGIAGDLLDEAIITLRKIPRDAIVTVKWVE